VNRRLGTLAERAQHTWKAARARIADVVAPDGDPPPVAAAPRPKQRSKKRRTDPFRRIPDRIAGSGTKTVIDVGAAHGTMPLYRRFPDAHLLLIDPLTEHEAELQEILLERDGSIEMCALGRESGESTLMVPVGSLKRTSFLERTALTEFTDEREERRVPIRRLDDVVAEHGPPAPYGLKIDTEGFELEVLLGATSTLQQCEWVVTETSIARRFEGSYEFFDLLSLMNEHGFRLENVLHVSRAGVTAKYADLLFTRRTADGAASAE
jgi:FkbM family methyltransferase